MPDDAGEWVGDGEEPLSNRELDDALHPFLTRSRRREAIKALETARLLVFREDAP